MSEKITGNEVESMRVIDVLINDASEAQRGLRSKIGQYAIDSGVDVEAESRKQQIEGIRISQQAVKESLARERDAPQIVGQRMVDGVRVTTYKVPGIGDDFPDAQHAVNSMIAGMNASLAPEETNNEKNPKTLEEAIAQSTVARAFYENPALFYWHNSFVPTAKALYVLQNPGAAEFPPRDAAANQEVGDSIPINDPARGIIALGPDAVGIRNRAVLAEIPIRNTLEKATSEGRTPILTSLGCGAAFPVLNATKNIQTKINLVDMDADALEFASTLAAERGLSEGVDFATYKNNLLRKSDKQEIVNAVGLEASDVVDILGVFEYFHEKSAQELLDFSYSLLKPGGTLVYANMLDSRPEYNFYKKVICWPGVKCRSISETIGIATSIGIEKESIDAAISDDGIYVVITISKPPQEGKTLS